MITSWRTTSSGSYDVAKISGPTAVFGDADRETAHHQGLYHPVSCLSHKHSMLPVLLISKAAGFGTPLLLRVRFSSCSLIFPGLKSSSGHPPLFLLCPQDPVFTSQSPPLQSTIPQGRLSPQRANHCLPSPRLEQWPPSTPLLLSPPRYPSLSHPSHAHPCLFEIAGSAQTELHKRAFVCGVKEQFQPPPRGLFYGSYSTLSFSNHSASRGPQFTPHSSA